MKSKRIIIVAAAAVAVIAAVLLCRFYCFENKGVLVLKDSDTKKTYARYKLDEGDAFSITFVHSVNKSPVTESYTIKDGRIYLTECRYYAFGAGVATALEEGQTLRYDEDGAMVISNINTLISNLIYVVGTISDHVLEINEETVSLRELCGQNSRVSFIYKD